MPRESGSRSAKRAFASAVVVAVVAVTVLSVAVAGMAGAQTTRNSTTVSSCTTIDSPGNYVLTGDVTNGSIGDDGSCIEITANNVVFDGAGHTVSGGGSGHGVEINGTRNVTVKRVHANNWLVGVFSVGADNGTIQGTVTNDNTEGVALGGASGNTLLNNTGYDNAIGVALGGESQNNTIRNEVAVDNKWGIHFERESGHNTVRNSTARNNSNWDYYATQDNAQNTVTDLRTSTATVSFTGQNVAMRSVTSPPELPSGTGNLDTYINATKTTGSTSSLSLTMQYGSSNGTVALWRTDGQQWSHVEDAEVNASANAVSADDLTQFGTFAVLSETGNGGEVTVSTSRPPSVQRTLTPVAGTPTATQTSAAGSTTTGPSTTATSQAGSSTQSNAGTTAAASGTSGSSDTTSSNGPGFGLGVALLAVVAAALVALRRTR